MHSQAGNKLFYYSLLLSILCLVLFIFSGCSDNDPEEEIRSFLKTAEKEVEENNIRAVRNLVADSYHDSQGRGKKDITSYLSYQLLRKKSIHIFLSIDAIHIPGDGSASATVFAAMTGQPVDSASILPQIQADIYKVNLSLTKDSGEWKLLSAEWQPALIDDILKE